MILIIRKDNKYKEKVRYNKCMFYSTDQFLDLIKENALKNSGGSDNWSGRNSVQNVTHFFRMRNIMLKGTTDD